MVDHWRIAILTVAPPLRLLRTEKENIQNIEYRIQNTEYLSPSITPLFSPSPSPIRDFGLKTAVSDTPAGRLERKGIGFH